MTDARVRIHSITTRHGRVLNGTIGVVVGPNNLNTEDFTCVRLDQPHVWPSDEVNLTSEYLEEIE